MLLAVVIGAHLQHSGALSPSLLGCLAVPRRLQRPDGAPMDLSVLGLQRFLQAPQAALMRAVYEPTDCRHALRQHLA